MTSLAWLLAGWSGQLGAAVFYPLGIEPMYPGLACRCVVWLVLVAETATART